MAEKVTLTPEQLEAIAEIDRNLQIIACAGSGKTEVITRRIAGILQSKSNVRPENIVAFTFTEKAAESMKRRIAKALGKDGAFPLSENVVESVEPLLQLSYFHRSHFRDGLSINLEVCRFFVQAGAVADRACDFFVDISDDSRE